MAAANNPQTVSAAKPIPLIGPEIGPDPRNMYATFHFPGHPVFLDEASGIRYDFHHSFRIEMPQGNGPFTLRVYDMDSEVMLQESVLQSGALAVGPLKYFIRYRLTVEQAGKLIFMRDYDCTDQKVLIIIPDGALGENLAWIPYAEAFRVEHHAKVTCACGEWIIRLVQKQYPELDFIPIASQPSTKDFYACYVCAIFPKERKTWRPSDHQNFGLQGSVAKLLGVEPVPRKIKLDLSSPRPFPEPYVCISTMASNPAKHWNYPDGWNQLCRYLKRLGYRVLVLDRDPHQVFAGKHYRVPEEAEDWTGLRPISERIAVLQHAAFFIGLSSGLSWLAWNCNIPVVMFSGFTLDGSEFPTPYRIANYNFCHGCWNDSTLFFDSTMPVWCPRHVNTPREIECTRVVTTKMFIDTVNRIPDAAKRFSEKKAQKPEVSVIITSSHGDFLQETLASIERMIVKSGVPTEIIVYDDASNSAETQLMFDRLQSVYPDILHVYHGKKNIGAALGRNEAIRHARADYLLIFDDDDIMLPFDLRGALTYLKEHPETPMSYAQKYLFSREKGFLNDIHGAPHSLFEAFFVPKVNINAALIRKEALIKVGGFQPVNGDPKANYEDIEFIIRLGLTGPLHFDPQPRSLYRIHNRQQTAVSVQWNNEITLAPTRKAPELFQRILNGEIPDVNGVDFRLIRGLMGAAVFFNQLNRKITTPILQAALKQFPDDWGVWHIYFYTLVQDGKVDEALKAFPEVEKRFKNIPIIIWIVFQPILVFYHQTKQPIPQNVQNMQNEILRRFLALPPIVLEEFQRLFTAPAS